MPIYVYEEKTTGKTVELFRPVAQRDVVPANLRRIMVPQTIGYANSSHLREPGVQTDVPKAFRDYEASGVNWRTIEKETGFSRDRIRSIHNF